MANAENREQRLEKVFHQVSEITEAMVDRKRRGVDTVDDLEHKANERYRQQQKRWATELENLRHEVDSEYMTESQSETKSKMLQKEIHNITKKIMPIKLCVEEFESDLTNLQGELESKREQAAKGEWDKATKKAQQEAKELEERQKSLRQQLDTVRREIDAQAMSIANENAAIAALEKRIRDKKAAQDRRRWDVEQEKGRLEQQHQALIRRMDMQFEEKLASIKQQFEEDSQQKFEEIARKLEEEYNEQLATQKARYDSLRRVLQKLEKDDRKGEIEAARKALSAAKEKAAMKDKLLKERERLQKTLDAGLSGRQQLRVDMDEAVQNYKAKLAAEVQKSLAEEERNRALDEKIDHLVNQVEALAKMLGLGHDAAAPDTPASPPQTARKRQKTATKGRGKRTRTEEVEEEEETVEGGEEAEPVAQQLNMDESVMVAPVGNFILQTNPGIEGDICISFVGEKGDHVVLENKTDLMVEMSGWKLLSIRGDETLQAHTFGIDTNLMPGEQMCVTFGADNGASDGFDNKETIGWAALPMEETRLELHSLAEGAAALVAHVSLSPAENTTMDLDQTETENQNANCRIM